MLFNTKFIGCNVKVEKSNSETTVLGKKISGMLIGIVFSSVFISILIKSWLIVIDKILIVPILIKLKLPKPVFVIKKVEILSRLLKQSN